MQQVYNVQGLKIIENMRNHYSWLYATMVVNHKAYSIPQKKTPRGSTGRFYNQSE